jgi:hypothetical protein
MRFEADPGYAKETRSMIPCITEAISRHYFLRVWRTAYRKMCSVRRNAIHIYYHTEVTGSLIDLGLALIWRTSQVIGGESIGLCYSHDLARWQKNQRSGSDAAPVRHSPRKRRPAGPLAEARQCWRDPEATAEISSTKIWDG